MSSLAKVRTVVVVGIKPFAAFVEVHIGRGLPAASVVGLGDTSVRESRERVRAAFESSGLPWPRGKITVNLAPADLPKTGTSFDLPIAAGIVAASGIAPDRLLDGSVLVGELGLDGTVKRCRNFLPVALHSRSEGHRLVCPESNRWEASLLEDCDFVPVGDLGDLVSYLRGDEVRVTSDLSSGAELTRHSLEDSGPDLEFRGIVGHRSVVRAMTAAAAGMLNVLLWGPPGSGKTLVGRSSVSLLPDLDRDSALEVRMLHCLVSDRFDSELPRRPPLRAPHHTVSPAALVGGGPGIPRPGEVSLAHRGVLFLDELALFSSASLEALRQPLEDGFVRIARAKTAVEYPAEPMVIAATNTCPCGASRQASGEGPDGRCRCSDHDKTKFLRRISGPLIERFDLAVQMDSPDAASLLDHGADNDYSSLAAKVGDARALLAERLGEYGSLRRVPPKLLREILPLGSDARRLLERWAVLQRSSARRIHKMIRLSWALSALDGASEPDVSHVEEAVSSFVLPRELSDT
jgi:magnesium chelatase family protein